MNSVPFVGPLDRVLLLRTLPILEGLAPTHLAAIAQHAKERLFDRGSVLNPNAETIPAVYLIVDGAVEVERRGGPIRRHGPGDAIGFLEAFSRSPSGFRAQATQDTVALELDWEAQLDVCQEHFPVVMQYVAYLCKRSIEILSATPAINADSPETDALCDTGPMNLVERILALHRTKTFSRGSFDALSELAHHVKEVRWSQRKLVWQLSDRAEQFALIVSGSVRCMNSDGTSFKRHAGTTIGMYEAICHAERWHAALSETKSRALQIDVEPFIDILEDHFDLALDFLAVLSSNLIEFQAAESSFRKSA
jgi:CRP-like cAMP-binding protein